MTKQERRTDRQAELVCNKLDSEERMLRINMACDGKMDGFVTRDAEGRLQIVCTSNLTGDIVIRREHDKKLYFWYAELGEETKAPCYELGQTRPIVNLEPLVSRNTFSTFYRMACTWFSDMRFHSAGVKRLQYKKISI